MSAESSRPARAEAPSARPRGVSRIFFLALAVLFLAIGLVGVFVPVLPTVPFMLLAAWAAGRSSPRLQRWIEGHPRFGPPLRAWREHGAVPRRAKWAATVAMLVSGTGLLVFVGNVWAAATVAIMVVVLAWLWRRPELP